MHAVLAPCIGEIDGVAGSNQAGALRAYQRKHGLEATGELDDATWAALEADAVPTTVEVVLSPDDVAGPFVEIPDDMMAKAGLETMGFSDVVLGINSVRLYRKKVV